MTNELCRPRDEFDAMAARLNRTYDHTFDDFDLYWRNSGRMLLADVLQIVGEEPPEQRTMRRVQDILARSTLQELAQFLRDHGVVSATVINEQNLPAAETVRMIVATIVRSQLRRSITHPAGNHF